MGERILAELHDRALAELLLDLADGEIDGALAIHVDSHFTSSPASGCRARWSYSTPLSRASPATRLPFRGARSANGLSERHPVEGLVDRARAPEMAAIEDHLGGRPGAEVVVGRGLDGASEGPEATRRTHPADRPVSAEWPFLGHEAERRAGALARGRQPAQVVHGAADPRPDHAGSSQPRKGPQTATGELQRGDALGGGRDSTLEISEEPVGHLAQELEREVHARRVDPAQVRLRRAGAQASLGRVER